MYELSAILESSRVFNPRKSTAPSTSTKTKVCHQTETTESAPIFLGAARAAPTLAACSPPSYFFPAFQMRRTGGLFFWLIMDQLLKNTFSSILDQLGPSSPSGTNMLWGSHCVVPWTQWGLRTRFGAGRGAPEQFVHPLGFYLREAAGPFVAFSFLTKFDRSVLLAILQFSRFPPPP